jgi:hypothetical protein
MPVTQTETIAGAAIHNPKTSVSFGITEASFNRLRGLGQQVIKTDSYALEATAVMVREYAQALAKVLKEEFILGGHNKQTAWHGGEEPDPNYVHTVDTIKVSSGPMWAEVKMGGGSFYIESGTVGHQLTPGSATPNVAATNGAWTGVHSLFTSSPNALHWQDNGTDYYSAGHFVSGLESDPFVERAIGGANLAPLMAHLANYTWMNTFKGQRADFVAA